MDIRGGLLERGCQMSVVVVNGNFRFFRSVYLPNLHIYRHNYYMVLCSPLVALHWHRNGWPWMTLNCHFALKSGPSSASNGLAFWLSEKTVWKFAELHIDCQWQKMEPTHGTGDISVIGLFTGVPQRGSVKPMNCIHTHSFHTCCSLIYSVENKKAELTPGLARDRATTWRLIKNWDSQQRLKL